MESFEGKSITVIGAARSGVSATSVLVSLGARVVLADSKPAAELGAERIAAIEAAGGFVAAGASTREPSVCNVFPPETDLVVTSPGVPRTSELLEEAVRRGIPIWSEVELAYRLSRAPIVAVTGTNGKTTVTLLIAAILNADGRRAVPAGNISADEVKQTLVDAATASRNATDDTVIVAEISSFQLEWVERFAPAVAVLTNITPDHLNRYADFRDYAETKARLFAAQSAHDFAVLNADDPLSREIGARNLRAARIWFTRAGALPADTSALWLEDDTVVARMPAVAAGTPIKLMQVADIPSSLPGGHSVENVMAAAAAALAMGCSPEAIREAVRRFAGVPHRMEIVAEFGGVRYINNSMCTNIAAAISSLDALDRQAVVIAGGVDKGLDFAPLTPALTAHARKLILIGQAADHMESVFRAGGYSAISRAASLEEAAAMACAEARPGEAVLLCPACASFDMFADFEARGIAFRLAVHELREEPI